MGDFWVRSPVGRFADRWASKPVDLFGRHLRQRSRPAGFLPCQWFLAAGSAVMLCVPHAVWNNLWGVLFAAAALLFYFHDCAVYGRKALNPAALGPGAAVFLLICFVSILRAEYKTDSLRLAVFYLSGAVLVYSSCGCFSGEKDRSLLWDLLYAAMLVTAVYGLCVYAAFGSGYTLMINGEEYSRLCSTLEHGINYSEFIALCFPPVLVHCLQEKGPRRLWMTALLTLPLAALLLTYARTGWLALGAALVVLLAWKKPILLIPCALLLIPAAALLPESIRERMLSVFSWNYTSSSGRSVLWSACLKLLGKNWILGIGAGEANFRSAMLPYADTLAGMDPPHSNMGYLEMFLSFGIVGFAGFMTFFFGLPIRLWRRVRQLSTEKRMSGAALLASLFAGIVANIPEHLWFYPRILFLWCILAGCALSVTLPSGESA